MQEVEQRKSSCRGAEVFPADSHNVFRISLFSLPFKQAYPAYELFNYLLSPFIGIVMAPENIEALKLAIGAATPIVVAVLGLVMLRRIEGVKAVVAKQSDFQKKWAENFFETCQQFMQSIERYMALLNQLQTLSNPNGPVGTGYQNELNALNVSLPELELRIRRSVVFAPREGPQVSAAAGKSLAILFQMVKNMQGSFDALFTEMDLFNKAAKSAHAEMLGVRK
jgi:hypothetical protein